MTGLALEVDGWPPEPCDTADPEPVVRTGHGNPCANVPDDERDYRTTVTIHRPETCCDRDRAH